MTSWEAIVAMVRQRAATARPGEWILGRSWDQNLWASKAFPTHNELDAVAPDNPVYLTRVDGHAGVANAKAMALAGVTRDTKDPDGGRIIRDAAGRPSGTFVDGAQALVASKIPPESDAQLVDEILLADRECRRLGLTMVARRGDQRADDRSVRAAVGRRAGCRRASTRWCAGRSTSSSRSSAAGRSSIITTTTSSCARSKSSPTARSARAARRCSRTTATSPGNRGLLTTPPDVVYAQTLAASKAGFQTCIHAIGDRANREVLDVFERVQKEVPGSKALRMRDEHAQILSPADIPRFAELGVVASMQPTHCTSDMPWAPARLGAKRIAEGAYVWQKLMKTGVVIASGSDFPGRAAESDARLLRRDHAAGRARQPARRLGARPAHEPRSRR